MNVAEWIALTAVVLTALSGLAGIAYLVFQHGRLVEKVDGINTRLDTINGSVRDHAERIAHIEGAQG